MNYAVPLSEHLASYKSQLFGEKEEVIETKEIKKAKENYKDNPSEEGLIALVKAYNSSLLYRQSARLLEEGVKRFPSLELKKMLAIRYLTTNHVDEALAIYLSLEKELDPLYAEYRLGLCYFYKGDFKEAERHFLLALKTENLNDEMEVAIYYWLILTKLEVKERYDTLLNEYQEKDVGHHFGYLLFIRFLKKEISFEEALKQIEDGLTLSLFLAGTYVYSLGRDDKMNQVSESLLLSHPKYWASFSSLAFYYLHYNK